MLNRNNCVKSFVLAPVLHIGILSFAQTDIDAIMMSKKNLCTGMVNGEW